MSRSRRKTPITGNACSESEKHDKHLANKALRAKVRDALARDAEVMPIMREASNVWDFNKDGKQWLPKLAIAEQPKLMRK